RAALALLAGVLRAGEAEVLAQREQEARSRPDVGRLPVAVDVDPDPHRAVLSGPAARRPPSGGPGAPTTARAARGRRRRGAGRPRSRARRRSAARPPPRRSGTARTPRGERRPRDRPTSRPPPSP